MDMASRFYRRLHWNVNLISEIAITHKSLFLQNTFRSGGEARLTTKQNL
jgi:hypothetical protein